MGDRAARPEPGDRLGRGAGVERGDRVRARPPRVRRIRRRSVGFWLPSFRSTIRSCSATCKPRSRRYDRRSPSGRRICVHGDYDVDGICATALAVLVLRELDADVTWHLPSRFEEGYGIARETISRVAEDGVGLLLTVDCGITAVDEVAEATRLGLEVIVTDHHRPGETLPDCPVVATRPSRYPFPELCGTGVVLKLGEALLGADHPALREAPRPRCARDDRRRRPARRREPRARRRRAPRARLHETSRSARADEERASRPRSGGRGRGRIPARATDQRCRASRSPGRRARARPHGRRRAGALARRRARGAEPRAPGGRGPDPARGRERRSSRCPSRSAGAAATSSGTRAGTRASSASSRHAWSSATGARSS